METRRSLLPGLLSLPLLALGASPCPYFSAQQEGPRWFTTGQEIELAEVIEAHAASMGVPFEYDPAALRGTVRIRSGPGLSAEGLWNLTNRLLAERDLACIQAAGEDALSIVSLERAGKEARLEEGNPRDAIAGFVRALVPVEHRSPEEVASLVAGFLTAKGSSVQAVPGGQHLMIAGLRPQVVESLDLIASFDKPEPGVTVVSVETTHVPAATLVTLLERVSAARGKDEEPKLAGTVLANPSTGEVVIVAPEGDVLRWEALVRLFDQQEHVETRHYPLQRFGVGETARLVEDAVGRAGAPDHWRLVPDELTGTLIITATPSQHEQVQDLLTRLESTASATRALRSFPVRRRKVDDVLQQLEELLDLEGGLPVIAGDAAPTEPSEGEVAAPERKGGVGGRVGSSSPAVRLSMDEAGNRILAVGPPRLLEELGALIESLDVHTPQVLVEVILVSLSDIQSRDLAVELAGMGTVDGTLVRLASLFDAGVVSPAAANLPALAGTGFEGVVLDPGNFSALVRALELVNQGRTLTIPKVLVGNNQTATLTSVRQEPFTSTNASTTIATTSFGGTLDAGTTVTLKPQITDDERLLLEYKVALSTFVGAATDPALPPPRQENSLESTASIPDGFCVVIGGLEVDSQGEVTSRVPFLGSLPGIGVLFRSSSTSSSRSRFFVFLRCSLLRQDRFEDLRHATEPDLALAGVPDGPPRLEAIVIR